MTMSISTSAADYGIEKATLDGVPVYILRDTARAVEVRVAPSIGMNSYEMTVKGKRVFWSPYKTVGEFAAKPTFLGNPLLWPWANRIDGTSYFANGKKYHFNLELGNVSPGSNNTPIHGLLRYEKRWEVTRAEADNNSSLVEAKFEYSRYPEFMAQFPFAHTIHIAYRLSGGALTVETRIQNHATEAMPLSLGFHPYFQVNDAPQEQWKVALPAKTRYALSQKLVPTGETAANPYPNPVSLATVSLDDVFGDLQRDADGFARFSVQGSSEKVTVEYGPKYTVAVVYSPKGRGFICFEPMTGITNAFNAAQDGWYKGLQSIPAGGEWREIFRVVPSGF